MAEGAEELLEEAVEPQAGVGSRAVVQEACVGALEVGASEADQAEVDLQGVGEGSAGEAVAVANKHLLLYCKVMDILFQAIELTFHSHEGTRY